MATAWITQFRKGLVDFCILLAVHRRSLYGYSLVQMLRNAPCLEFTESTVYPALARMIDEELIRTTDRPSPMGPPRRYLSLTALGQRRLAEMRRHWTEVGLSIQSLAEETERGEPDGQ
jgi:PadR family transcriptional regulator PadR